MDQNICNCHSAIDFNRTNSFFLAVNILLIIALLSCSTDETNSQTEDIISFKDSHVSAICIQNFDRNSDSKISYAEAAAVTKLEEFFSNTNITSFDELQYFVGLENIGHNAFTGCKKLVSVKLPQKLSSIGNSAFFGCQSLTSINIPDGVTSIGNSAFSGCQSLTSINIPNGVTSIGNSAFAYCQNLTSINIPDGVISIGNSAFSGCQSLTSINIPDGVISIGNRTFSNCQNLQFITIPNSVTSIGQNAFSGCHSLTSLTFPKSVAKIDYEAFEGCKNLDITLLADSLISILINDKKPYDSINLFVQSSLVDKYIEQYGDYFRYILAIGLPSPSDDALSITTGEKLEISSVANQCQIIKFHTRGKWEVAGSEDWITYSPKSGDEGSNSITVTTTNTNRTKSERTTKLTISSCGLKKIVTITQRDEYAIFEQKNYIVSAYGGKLELSFKSNLKESDNLQLSSPQESWISWSNDSRLTRAEWSGKSYELTVAPNQTNNIRTTSFVLKMPTSDGKWVELDTAYVSQNSMASVYESKDFSADGMVLELQHATVGKGIPFVLMGDGFADKDIADGTYSRVMSKTLENLFSEEPIKSLRDYFDVYAVTAVSKNSGVDIDHKTVFSTVPSDIDRKIAFDTDKVDEYTKKVAGIDFENTLSVVIVNSNKHNGVTMLLLDEDTKLPRQRAIALCTLLDGANDEEFRLVLVHEAIGHGLAKLADENGYEHYEAPDDKVVRQLRRYHEWGWMVNVDVADDDASVLWSPFIGDSRFAAENIGRYEGAFTYAKGIYRPTEKSMMHSMNAPFNAPSRQAIYNKVMMLGLGKTATFDEFVAFDRVHKPIVWSYQSRIRH